MSIPTKPQRQSKFPVLNLGFRPFFLGAGLFAVVAMVIWFLLYTLQISIPLETINSLQWHAHEMIYGYSIAVIAGFVLTATKNWTGQQTVHGGALLTLVGLWLAARVFLMLGMNLLAAISDLVFIVSLNVLVILPIMQARQFKQLAVVTKLLLLAILNLLFYLGVFGMLENGIYLGIYGGLYSVVGLILMMGRRVVPFFIEIGVDESVKLFNAKAADLASLVLFLVFFITALLQSSEVVVAHTALALGLVNIFRLLGWHTKGLWQKPLLWSIYLAIWFISLGFVLYYLAYAIGFSKFIAIHSLAYGGIGMITLGMMARVSLGHTGRNIQTPPKMIGLAFAILLLGTIFRVFFCLLLPSQYALWIAIAQLLWIAGFLVFVCQYYTILTQQRPDGEFG